MGRIEALTGTRPAKGGSHPGFGTHNALLGLGQGTYLELVAPDPEQPRPARGLWTDAAPVGGGLMTWVWRSRDIAGLASTAHAAGAAIGETIDGERRQPDGTTLKWQLTNPMAMPFGGAVPFLIDWGDSPHPATSAPKAGTLTGFVIEHPESDKLAAIFASMGDDVEITKAPEFRIEARIECAGRTVTLR